MRKPWSASTLFSNGKNKFSELFDFHTKKWLLYTTLHTMDTVLPLRSK